MQVILGEAELLALAGPKVTTASLRDRWRCTGYRSRAGSCADADVSLRTFGNYFSSKYEAPRRLRPNGCGCTPPVRWMPGLVI